MKNKIKPSILPGFMELTPKNQLIFNEMICKFIKVYERNGCLPMDTPVIEKEEILLAKSAGETEKQIYRIEKADKKQALRFDLTVPFARYVAQYMNELKFPFKRYQLGKVYRGERNQRGRYREFYQLDVDIVGINKLAIQNDALVISLAAEALESIGLKDYTFQINNRKIINGFLELLKVPNKAVIFGLIDKIDKIGQDACFNLLIDYIGKEKAEYLMKILNFQGSSKEVLSFLKTVVDEISVSKGNEVETRQQLLEGIEELGKVIEILEVLGVDERNYQIALKIIRGLDYYTGTIFETVINNYETYGSVCSGGRYDDLTQLYTEQKIPGVGISIGVTRLFFVLQEIGFWVEKQIGLVDYLICPLGDTIKTCVTVKNKLQAQGNKVEIYLEEGNLKKQLNYANVQGIPYVVIIGEDEVSTGEMVVKNMTTGEQNKQMM